MAFCSNCGAYVPDGSAVCGSCGTPMQQNPQANQQQYYQQQQYQQQQYQQQYQQPYYQQPMNRMGGAGGYRVNIQRREAGMAILLSIITCGIYAIIWFFWIVSDLNTADPGPNDKDPATVLLLSIVTCGIYGIIWLFNAGQKVDNIRQKNGEAPSGSGTTYLLLSLFGLGIVVYYMIQTELNKVAAN